MEGGDKEGYKEAELRKKLTDIMVTYNLIEHFHDNVIPSKFKENRVCNFFYQFGDVVTVSTLYFC